MPKKKHAKKRKPSRTGAKKTSGQETWPQIVRTALSTLGGTATLQALYSIIEQHPRAQDREKANVRAKVRQCLQTSDAYVRIEPGRWAFAVGYSEQELARLHSERREQYPLKAER